MEPASPARFYSTALGALLLALGIGGFFWSASFGAPGEVEEALGAFAVNAWINLLHAALGALGLIAATAAARAYALAAGLLLTALAIWGFAIGAGDAILGFIPASAGDDWLHLGLGLLGLAAAAGTPKPARSAPARSGRRLEARADPAGEGT